MGRTTSITISTNPHTKTKQTQTIWFGNGEIRLNGETGQYIGEYAKDGGWWLAEVNFAGEAPIERAQSGGSWVEVFTDADGETRRAKHSVQTVSPPLTTATQAAQAVAWAWLACKALEGFADAATGILILMWEDYHKREAAEQAEREAAAEATWQEYRANGSWWYIVTKSNNYLVFNAAEERAFYTTQDGELFREVEAREEVDYALTCWDNPTIYPYVGEVWAYYFRASFADSEMNNSAAHLFCTYVAFDELETPEQVSAYIFISESEELDDIPEWVMNVEFRWKLSFLKGKESFTIYEDIWTGENRGTCKARRDQERTIIADCK